MPAPKTQPKDTRSPEEIAIQSASNSSYNLCTPMADAEFVRFKNPITKLDMHMSTKSELFYSTMQEFCNKGLKKKLLSEFMFFSQEIDPKWLPIHDKILKNAEQQEAA